MGEAEAACMKGVSRKAVQESVPGERAARRVDLVAHDGMSASREMNSDLMGPPGLVSQGKESRLLPPFQDAVMGHGFFARTRARARGAAPQARARSMKAVGNGSRIISDGSPDEGEILPGDGMRPELIRENSIRRPAAREEE
jgi:hypothetical protein